MKRCKATRSGKHRFIKATDFTPAEIEARGELVVKVIVERRKICAWCGQEKRW